MFDFLDWMPEQASTFAPEVDWINNFITITSFLCIVAITGAMLYFAYKYRRKSDDQEIAYIKHDVRLETVWTVVPTIVCIFCFYIGWASYKDMRTPPPNAIDINVEAYQWGWNYEYESGKTASGELVVPVNSAVRLIMRSRDVNHSLFIPAMRVKEDVLANKYNYLWFKATKVGEYPIFCTEYCGLAHSNMLSKLRVVEAEVYEDYINDRIAGGKELTPAEKGQKVFANNGCGACHSIDGSKIVGPSLLGILGRKGVLEGGEEYVSDEDYIRESIYQPQAKVVAGYPPQGMYSFEGKISEGELIHLISYLKTLKKEG